MGLFDQILATGPGEVGEGQDLIFSRVEVRVHLGQGLDGVQQPVVLGMHRVGVDLVEHAVSHGFNPTPSVLGARTHQIDRVMGPASLPGRTRQIRAIVLAGESHQLSTRLHSPVPAGACLPLLTDCSRTRWSPTVLFGITETTYPS